MIEQCIFERVGHVKLNAHHNTLTFALTQALAQHLSDLDKNHEIHVIVLSGTEKAFSVGANLKELASLNTVEALAQSFGGKNSLQDPLDHWLSPWEVTATLTKPLIIVLDGYVLGGGLEIALMGDVIFATPRTLLGQPEVKLGLLPGCGGTVRLMHAMGYHRTASLCLTGEMITAQEGYNYGIINKIVEGDALDHALGVAQNMAALPLGAIKTIKKHLRRAYDHNENTFGALKEERTLFKELLHTPESREKIKTFLAKLDDFS